MLRQRLILRLSGAISKEKRRKEGGRDKLAATKQTAGSFTGIQIDPDCGKSSQNA
jgi:hypothetical protein